jgi:hypothetical protein
VITVEVEDVSNVIRWLEDNVGYDLTDYTYHTYGVRHYNGIGWELTATFTFSLRTRHVIDIEFEDDKDATAFLLRWS